MVNRNDTLMDALMESNGWEGLDVTPPEDKGRDEALDLAHAYHNAFREGAGKFVLDDLVNRYLTKPIARSGEDLVTIGIREGRADIIRQILAQIEFSKRGEK